MKKISMRLTKSVQDLMATDAAHGTPPGILNAMDFPNKIFRTVLDGYLATEEDAKRLGKEVAWKFFKPEHEEGRDTRDAIIAQLASNPASS